MTRAVQHQIPARIHVLLAAYDGETHLTQQVLTILAQVGVAVSLTIRVDPSADGTLKIAHRLADSYPEIEVVRNTTGSGGAAANFLLLLTRDVPLECDYVALADQDDVWFPDKLQRALQVLQATGTDGYSSNVLAWWPGRKTRLIDKAQAQRGLDHLYSAPGPGCTFVMRYAFTKKFADALRAHWDLALGAPLHDWLIYAWAREAGYRWTIDEAPGMLYRQHSSNVVGANTGLRAARSRMSPTSRTWYYRAVRAVADFVQASTDRSDASRSRPRPERLVMDWRELRRPTWEAAVCAAILTITPRDRIEGERV